MSEGKREEAVRGTFVVAAVNSAEGFLQRALAVKSRDEVLQALEGAEQWIARAKQVVADGELPDGFGAPELRAPGPRLPLRDLDGGDGGA